MYAIETRFLGATNTKGARIVASTATGQRLVISYPYSSTEQAHRVAAEWLARDMRGFDGCELIAAETRRGYVFVPVPAGHTAPARGIYQDDGQ